MIKPSCPTRWRQDCHVTRISGSLKTEFYYRRVWPTQTGAKLAVGAWIEDRYNRRRRHSSIGQISPVAFEMQHCNQTAADQQAA